MTGCLPIGPPMRTPSGIPYGSLHASECQQAYSIAFAYAIAAAARCTISEPRSDVETIDYTVRQAQNHRRYSSAVVDVQMKCTTQDVLRDDGVHWSLKRAHYDGLRDPDTYHRKILVVLVVPPDVTTWLDTEPDRMILRGRAFWTCLEGEGPAAGSSKTVLLPRRNTYNVEQLLGILQRIGDGGRP
ncbi:conserved hypothetical protein [Frankia canadensis]|uniref:DUF4365 domain-containing protein n=2 Tax=Frankia canadensis TaxID=1836972 RepID=A0A2I2KPA4_9ACTN|nr:conserved hypothetical protein [Frankia canadensis]SOU54784.1 conserved hypothetical protein [Frankia canadensis]